MNKCNWCNSRYARKSISGGFTCFKHAYRQEILMNPDWNKRYINRMNRG